MRRRLDGINTPESRVLIGVTMSDDPSPENWRGFAIDADSTDRSWADFPRIGLDARGLYVATSMQTIPDEDYCCETLIGVPKSSLTAAIPSIDGAVKVENVNGFAIGVVEAPAVDLDNLAESLPTISTQGLGSGQLSMSSIPNDFFEDPIIPGRTTITVTSRGAPPDAHQPGPNDDIVTREFFSTGPVLQNGSLWAVHTVNVSGRAGLQWYQIRTADNELLQSGTISDPSLDLYMPSIAVNDFEDVIIGFNGSDNDTPISTYVVVGRTTEGTTSFSPVTLTQRGNGDIDTKPIDPIGRQRWGDYSSTVVDPTNERVFWTFQEFVDGQTNTDPDFDNWSIRVTQIVVPSSDPTIGDFDGNGILDAGDINMLVWKSASGTANLLFDVNGDNQVDRTDVSTWAKDLMNTWIGDANLDGEFNTTDLVSVFQAGKFESGDDAVWTQGDWTGDHRFGTGDLVAAFQDGGYEQGPRMAINAVPEPASVASLLGGVIVGMVVYRRRR